MSSVPAIKICGVTRPADVAALAAFDVAYVGVVLVPGSPRYRPPAEAAAALAPWPRQRVGVFVDASEDAMAAAAETLKLHVLQLHGAEPPAVARAWRERGWQVWKAVRVAHPEDVVTAVAEYGDVVDLLLLDSWSPGAYGGTGRRFAWDAVAEALAALAAVPPIGVAGGLTPANVREAIAALRPRLVDVSSGVERAPGHKDPARVAAFVAAVREVAQRSRSHL